MRRAVFTAVIVLAAAGCGGARSPHFTADQVRSAFAAQGLSLTTKGYFKFGPARHVLYLWWASRGGIQKTRTGLVIVAARGFYVLVFRSSNEAAAALHDAAVARYLRVGQIPASQRGNVVLTNKVPVDAADWRRWSAVLATVGH